jgi:hypothetical protein
MAKIPVLIYRDFFMLKFIGMLTTAILFIFTFSLGCGGQLKGEGAHTFYLYGKTNSAKIESMSEQSADSFIYLKGNLYGESVIFYNKSNLKSFIKGLNATAVFSEVGEDFNCEYYYSPKIKGSIILNGKKINLHVCYQKDYIVVGTPIVYGSF